MAADSLNMRGIERQIPPTPLGPFPGLYGNVAPATVHNLLAAVRSGGLDGTVFSRIRWGWAGGRQWDGGREGGKEGDKAGRGQGGRGWKEDRRLVVWERGQGWKWGRE